MPNRFSSYAHQLNNDASEVEEVYQWMDRLPEGRTRITQAGHHNFWTQTPVVPSPMGYIYGGQLLPLSMNSP